MSDNNQNQTGIAILLNLVQAVNNLNQTITAVLATRFTGNKSYNPPSLANDAFTSTTLTVTGASLLTPSYAQASFSLDLQGIQMSAYVSAADTVAVTLFNKTGGTIDLASGTLSVVVKV